MPRSITQEEVIALMSPYGTVEECFLLKDKITGEGKGAGFVVFSKVSEAQRAIQGLHGNLTLPSMKNTIQVC